MQFLLPSKEKHLSHRLEVSRMSLVSVYCKSTFLSSSFLFVSPVSVNYREPVFTFSVEVMKISKDTIEFSGGASWDSFSCWIFTIPFSKLLSNIFRAIWLIYPLFLKTSDKCVEEHMSLPNRDFFVLELVHSRLLIFQLLANCCTSVSSSTNLGSFCTSSISIFSINCLSSKDLLSMQNFKFTQIWFKTIALKIVNFCWAAAGILHRNSVIFEFIFFTSSSCPDSRSSISKLNLCE